MDRGVSWTAHADMQRIEISAAAGLRYQSYTLRKFILCSDSFGTAAEELQCPLDVTNFVLLQSTIRVGHSICIWLFWSQWHTNAFVAWTFLSGSVKRKTGRVEYFFRIPVYSLNKNVSRKSTDTMDLGLSCDEGGPIASLLAVTEG